MMLGQAISMVLPKVVGYKLVGQVNQWVTSTDVVLTITKVTTENSNIYKKYNMSNIAFFRFIVHTRPQLDNSCTPILHFGDIKMPSPLSEIIVLLKHKLIHVMHQCSAVDLSTVHTILHVQNVKSTLAHLIKWIF